MMPLFFDWTMMLLLPAMLLAMWAQARVKSTFAEYSHVTAQRGVTAEQVARQILDSYGLREVPIRRVAGELTDHYDPRDKSLSLSDSVYGSRSIAAIGVAAHEVGHAVQDKVGYKPLVLRNTIVPVVSFTSQADMPLFFLGLLFGGKTLMDLGILLFVGVLVLHLVTLPVEFDASNRALAVLGQGGALTTGEVGGAKKVLNAAAMTYVAATFMAASQLLRLLMLRNRYSSRD